MKPTKLFAAILLLISTLFTVTACNDDHEHDSEAHGHSHD